jgi:hypothetical protein
LIGRILHEPERAWVRIPPRKDLVSKNLTGGPDCDARHDAIDILTATSPVTKVDVEEMLLAVRRFMEEFLA